MRFLVRIKILLLITLSELGGAQKVVHHIAAGLDPRQFDITVACAPGGELVNWLRNMHRDIKIVEITDLKRDISPLNEIKAFMKLYALMKKNSYHIAHCHSSKAGVLGRLAAWLAGVPKIFFTAHGWGINEYQNRVLRFFYTWMERLAGAVSTKVVCVSESDLMKARSLKLVSDEKLCLIYNGLPELKTREGSLRRELNLAEKDIIVGTVARLAPQKDPLFLLEVAERMINCHNGWSGEGGLNFVLIGDGSLRPECEKFINDKGLKGHVFLLGTREEAAHLVHDFDIFVLLSRWEGLPLTIIEAMMSGRPVVANSVGGVGELVVHRETGLLINKLDADEAEKALFDLISNPEKRLSMGHYGRQRARNLFNIDQMVDKYKKLYLSII
ncbi:glycosyltransferase family 4 protein [Pelotomaculum propionicicum]|uniref:glycosyltransferase family 4 protein n=1 Tax=Pelotomaculum propionicicum TaxID=258475 RepID=UPI003B795C77